MYIVCFSFKSNRLEVKLKDSFIFSSVEDIVNFSKTQKLREYDLCIDQDMEIKKEIANHWVKKNDNKEQSDGLYLYLINSNHSLPFPFCKLTEVKEGQAIGKLKPAMIINDKIYTISGLKDDGVYYIIDKEIV